MKNKWIHNITCIGYVTGDIETLNDKCPQHEKGQCYLNGKTCKYFMGLKITNYDDDSQSMKGCCEYLLDLKNSLVNKLKNYDYEGMSLNELEKYYKYLTIK